MAYQSPGVYVEEVASGAAPIGGVGTSTAGFIGLIPDTVKVPTTDLTTNATIKRPVNDRGISPSITQTIDNVDVPTFHDEPWRMPPGCSLEPECNPVLITNFTEFTERFGSSDGTIQFTTTLKKIDDATTYTYLEVDASSVDENNALALAVRGFFLNGGTRCWVARVADLTTGGENGAVEKALERLALVDEVALVAIPVIQVAEVPDDARMVEIKNLLISHCEALGDRFAIIDGVPEDPVDVRIIKGGYDVMEGNPAALAQKPGVPATTYGAIYFPWIDVTGKGGYLPPSGHIAGLYARVDTARGVHKAPANEVLRGAMGLQHRISAKKQDGLNPEGINAIREFDGTIKVWGARTLKKNDEFTYINVRRLFLFLRESIDEGTQWAVFEPNGPQLWARIVRNITAFLTNVWSTGALFGDKPEQAFYVKCDAETNPERSRDLGQVVTEIGVAVLKPAEFVIFRIGQTPAK